jgi:hypothetical protein
MYLPNAKYFDHNKIGMGAILAAAEQVGVFLTLWQYFVSLFLSDFYDKNAPCHAS